MFRKKASVSGPSGNASGLSAIASYISSSLTDVKSGRRASFVGDRSSISSSASSEQPSHLSPSASLQLKVEGNTQEEILKLPTHKTKASISLAIVEHGDLGDVIPKKIEKLNKLDKINQKAPIHYAALYGNFGDFSLLLQLGGDQLEINLKDGFHRTALIYVRY
jgi:hypothetical protein